MQTPSPGGGRSPEQGRPQSHCPAPRRPRTQPDTDSPHGRGDNEGPTLSPGDRVRALSYSRASIDPRAPAKPPRSFQFGLLQCVVGFAAPHAHASHVASLPCIDAKPALPALLDREAPRGRLPPALAHLVSLVPWGTPRCTSHPSQMLGLREVRPKHVCHTPRVGRGQRWPSKRGGQAGGRLPSGGREGRVDHVL